MKEEKLIVYAPENFPKYKPNFIDKTRWSIYRFFRDFEYHLRQVKWASQRALRGWGDNDAWNMDYYLTKICIPMLKRLKEDKHGVPCIWNEEKDEEILFEEAEKIWDEKLDTMIAGFEAAKRIQDGDYPIKEYIKYYKKDEEIFKKGMKVFTDNFFSLWD